MEGKKCKYGGYYKLMGCLTAFLNLVGFVFYVILMVRVFKAGTDWLTTVFIILGLVAMVTVVPTLANLFMGRGMAKNYYHLDNTEE